MKIMQEFLGTFFTGIERIEFQGKKVGTDIFLINFIANNKGCSMTQIRSFLNVPPSTATRRVKKLRSLGFVDEIEDDPGDKREVRIQLSDTGKALFLSFLQERLMGLDELQKIFPQEKIDIFFEVMQGLSGSTIGHKLRTRKLLKDE